ncbi:protein prenyltransferase alpha subunit repeat-containing protein 1 [Daktulosphaira vitifoliae]|uniref:protein prenyltransferase alpha subunit repeat-containing protein 1 n=1 Tax=Daktulosphaira vitifoliae TaxID=58002 RepID=UPI0021AA97E0|nr:protein prenyltransferase alpha subunit repeat-containing protein 1 [Daktulosphaira vitifoliae]
MDVDDNFPAALRIVTEIQNIVNKDVKLKEFDLVIQPESQNKSPVLHVEHCLGLETWCVRHVYQYVYQRLILHRKRLKRIEPNDVVPLLTCALLINPEVFTFWNMRKELVLSGFLELYAELHFSSLSLSFKPKCAEIFIYRRWILKNIQSNDSITNDIVLNELSVTMSAAAAYASNYSAWNHSFWIVEKSLNLKNFQIMVHQWDFTKKWCREHVSDHSCMQYRQRLLKCFISDKSCLRHLKSYFSKSLVRFFNPEEKHKIMKPSDECINEALGVIIDELYFNEDLIVMYHSHEALWNHRRFLCHLLANTYCTDSVKEVLMNNERRICTSIIKGNETFIKKHAIWLQRTLSIPIKLL